MTTLTAAASTAKSIPLDFATKSTPAAGEPNAFASKLQDAQRDAKSDIAPPVAEAKKPSVEKPKHIDDGPDDRVDAAAEAKPAKPAKKPTDDRPVDPADDAEAAGDTPADQKPAPVAKTSGDALLAALAASATPVAAAPESQPVEAESNPRAAATDLTPVAAAATIQANAPVALDDGQAAVEASARPQAAVAADAKAKPGDAKLDVLTAKLKPVSDPNAPLPPEAAQQDASGDPQKYSSNQHEQPSGDGDAPVATPADAIAAPAAKADATKEWSFDDLLSKLATPAAAPTRDAPAPTPPATPLRPEQQFARDNVDRVVSTVQSHVEAGGNGTMNVRLDPPELGALDVAAKMLDGKMSVSFTTSNEQATQLLSHSLNHLKSSLESAGISVDRIEVRQVTATSTSASSDRNSSGQQQAGERGFESATQQQGEQQRKQMVERLWRKYAYGSDEIDLVA